MYQPPHFREDRIEVQHDLIRNHSLGLLITAGPGGLMANPVPFLIDDATSKPDASKHDVSKLGTLRAHIARGNPHWHEFAGVNECLVVFQGPQEYVTPSWYATKQETGKVVPTWNYVTVHAWGKPRVVEDAAWLRRQLDDLTLLKEGKLPKPWAVDDAPEPYVVAQMKGIVGIEIPIDRIEGKWKVSQNRPEKDRATVVTGLRAGGESAAIMADLVEERSKRMK